MKVSNCIENCIEHSVKYLYVPWWVDSRLLGMGLKWSVITDILVMSGYFPTVSRYVNRWEFVWCVFPLSWFLDRRGWITTIWFSIILPEIIEWNIKIIITSGDLRTALMPAPNRNVCYQKKWKHHSSKIILNSLSMIRILLYQWVYWK